MPRIPVAGAVDFPTEIREHGQRTRSGKRLKLHPFEEMIFTPLSEQHGEPDAKADHGENHGNRLHQSQTQQGERNAGIRKRVLFLLENPKQGISKQPCHHRVHRKALLHFKQKQERKDRSLKPPVEKELQQGQVTLVMGRKIRTRGYRPIIEAILRKGGVIVKIIPYHDKVRPVAEGYRNAAEQKKQRSDHDPFLFILARTS